MQAMPQAQASLSSFQLTVFITITLNVTLLPPSLPQLPSAPQQPHHVVCHIIL